MKSTLAFIAILFPFLAPAAPLRPPTPELPRLVLYHQTTHSNASRPISLLPLINNPRIALTHLIIAAFHVNANSTIHLNDHPPSHARYRTLWREARALQSAGVKVLAMVGGAARGSFSPQTLDANSTAAFERSYALLRDAVAEHGLDGVDLDVEEHMSLAGITRLIARLRDDFGAGFVITLAPVATALARRRRPLEVLPLGGGANAAAPVGGKNLSGFDYAALEHEVGREVTFYNVQFYNGFGSVSGRNSTMFDMIVDAGWEPRRIAVGQLTSPRNGGGFVEHADLGRAVGKLREKYGEIGGIGGWEYFNGVPGGAKRPWVWAEEMTRILRPGMGDLKIGRRMGKALKKRRVEGGSGQGRR
ncbi:hypothetical protein VTI74DRAFT_794 [Chaetomium olivicolor]